MACSSGAESASLWGMETANRDEAERCLKLAREAKAAGQMDKAKRLAEKSVRLCSTEQARGERSLVYVYIVKGVGGDADPRRRCTLWEKWFSAACGGRLANLCVSSSGRAPVHVHEITCAIAHQLNRGRRKVKPITIDTSIYSITPYTCTYTYKHTEHKTRGTCKCTL